MAILSTGERLPDKADFAASLALSEAHGPANARLIDGLYKRARDYEEDPHTALLSFIRTDEGMKDWEEARSERLRADEASPS